MRTSIVERTNYYAGLIRRLMPPAKHKDSMSGSSHLRNCALDINMALHKGEKNLVVKKFPFHFTEKGPIERIRCDESYRVAVLGEEFEELYNYCMVKGYYPTIEPWYNPIEGSYVSIDIHIGLKERVLASLKGLGIIRS